MLTVHSTSRYSRLRADYRTILEDIGFTVLKHARQDYEAKSEGGADRFGTRWKKNSPQTIARKARKSPQVRTLKDRSDSLKERARQARRSGSRLRAKRLADQRRAITRQINRIIRDFANLNRIGVDTGLQEASGVPFFEAGDNKGGNEFEFKGDRTIVVGYERSYSPLFDRTRPIFPQDGSIHPQTEEEIETQVKDWVISKLQRIGQ